MAVIVTSKARLAALGLLLVAVVASATGIDVGAVTLFIGNGTNPGAINGDGFGANGASLNGPQGCAIDQAGNFFVADTVNNVIRRVAAGSSTTTTFIGAIGQQGDVAATGENARLKSPHSFVFASDFSFAYLTDFAAHRILTVDPSTAALTAFVGTGLPGDQDGTGVNAQLNGPSALAIKTDSGDLFVSEKSAHRIRKITAGGVTSAFTGRYNVAGDDDQTLNTPVGVAVMQTTGAVYIADSANMKVKVSTSAGGTAVLVAGSAVPNGETGHVDGVGSAARFVQPWGLVMSPNATYLYIADKGNNLIRRLEIATAMVDTILGTLASGWTANEQSTLALVSSPSMLCAQAADTLLRRLYITGDNAVAIITAPEQPTTTTTTSAPTSTSAAANSSTTTPPVTTTSAAGPSSIGNTTVAPPTLAASNGSTTYLQSSPTTLPPSFNSLTTMPPSINAAGSARLVTVAIAAAVLVAIVA